MSKLNWPDQLDEAGMRQIKHWTPFYVVSRIRLWIDHRLNPANPWLTRDSVRLLAQLLRPDDIALEFGSGRSTLWIARRVKKLISVEDDGGWRERGLEKLKQEKIENVDLLHRPKDVADTEGGKAAERVLDGVPEASVGFCLVDGMYRGYCALGALAKMKGRRFDRRGQRPLVPSKLVQSPGGAPTRRRTLR